MHCNNAKGVLQTTYYSLKGQYEKRQEKLVSALQRVVDGYSVTNPTLGWELKDEMVFAGTQRRLTYEAPSPTLKIIRLPFNYQPEILPNDIQISMPVLPSRINSHRAFNIALCKLRDTMDYFHNAGIFLGSTSPSH